LFDLFLDESGCLGFDLSRNKSSKYFVITILCVPSECKGSLEKLVKKVFGGFAPHELKTHANTLHFAKEKPQTRKKLLGLLANRKDVSVMVIYFNKVKINSIFKNQPQLIYKYMTGILLNQIFANQPKYSKSKGIRLIASRRETNKFLNQAFKEYIEEQVLKKHKIKLEVIIQSSESEKCLQIVDGVCWSIFRKYEHQDYSYAEIIQHLIGCEYEHNKNNDDYTNLMVMEEYAVYKA